MSEKKSLLCEGTFSLENAHQFLSEDLGSPIDLVAASISSFPGNPVVHPIVDGLAPRPREIKKHNLTPIESTYLKPGHTPIAALAVHDKTGLQITVTQQDAQENPNFEVFERMLFSSCFSDGVVRDDPHENHVNMLACPNSNLTIYARLDESQINIPLTETEDLKFVISKSCIAYCTQASTKIMAATIRNLARHVEDRGHQFIWKHSATFDRPVLSFSRVSKDNNVLIGFIPEGETQALMAWRPIQYRAYNIKQEEGDVTFSAIAEELSVCTPQDITGRILGPTTTCSENDEPRLAVLRTQNKQNPFPTIDFIPYKDLQNGIRTLVERVLSV